MEPVGVDDRMAAGLRDIDVLKADGSHALGEPIGTGADIVTVGAEHPDGGDAQELDELVEALVSMLQQIGLDGLDGRHDSPPPGA